LNDVARATDVDDGTERQLESHTAAEIVRVGEHEAAERELQPAVAGERDALPALRKGADTHEVTFDTGRDAQSCRAGAPGVHTDERKQGPALQARADRCRVDAQRSVEVASQLDAQARGAR